MPCPRSLAPKLGSRSSRPRHGLKLTRARSRILRERAEANPKNRALSSLRSLGSLGAEDALDSRHPSRHQTLCL